MATEKLTLFVRARGRAPGIKKTDHRPLWAPTWMPASVTKSTRNDGDTHTAGCRFVGRCRGAPGSRARSGCHHRARTVFRGPVGRLDPARAALETRQRAIERPGRL